MPHTTLSVHTSQHTYPIIIKSSTSAFDFARYIQGKQVLIVSNDTVANLYLEPLLVQLSEFEVATCILPDGEVYKTQTYLNQIYDTLMSNYFGRDCTLIALGGGVIGDMTGFAAASFMRGVNFIQMPTTLLSQVDSSVGGKTGINHALGKNMIGAFWQPVCVFADMTTLNTLPTREFAAGLAEVVKYALIMDATFLTWLKTHQNAILAKDSQILAQMVYQCCQYKAQIVADDEKEQGKRALLNFGHTFGHAIETYMGYGTWLHGEAVAVGMVQAAYLSQLLGLINQSDVHKIIDILRTFGLPVATPDIPIKTALDLMSHDKKVKAGKIRFVLLKKIGHAFVSADVPEDKLRLALTPNTQPS